MLIEEEISISAGTLFENLSIPMIRRVIPSLIAADIVGVQPMTNPIGMIFDMKYDDD